MELKIRGMFKPTRVLANEHCLLQPSHPKKDVLPSYTETTKTKVHRVELAGLGLSEKSGIGQEQEIRALGFQKLYQLSARLQFCFI